MSQSGSTSYFGHVSLKPYLPLWRIPTCPAGPELLLLVPSPRRQSQWRQPGLAKPLRAKAVFSTLFPLLASISLLFAIFVIHLRLKTPKNKKTLPSS